MTYRLVNIAEFCRRVIYFFRCKVIGAGGTNTEISMVNVKRKYLNNIFPTLSDNLYLDEISSQLVLLVQKDIHAREYY